MGRLLFLVITLVCCTTVTANNAPAKPGTHKKIACTDGKHTFNLFIPKAYETKPEKQFPVLYISSPKGNPSFQKLEKWAEKRDFILIGINDSKNGPETIVIAAQDAVLESTAYLRKHHCLQLATGMSGAASSSVKLARRYPQMIAGVLLHAHSGNGNYCVRGQSVTFLYGAKDTIQPPDYVESAIKKYEQQNFHLATKKLKTAHKWGGLEDTKDMLDFMFDFQRYNNPHLTKEDIASDLESQLKTSSAIDDVVKREASLFQTLQSISLVPAVARSSGSKKMLAAWNDSYTELIKMPHESPIEAFAQLNYAKRSPLIKQLKGTAKSQLNALLEPILDDETVAKEIKAQSTFKRLFQKEAKLNGRESSIKAMIKQYEKMIVSYPDTTAAEQAELRIAALEGQ